MHKEMQTKCVKLEADCEVLAAKLYKERVASSEKSEQLKTCNRYETELKELTEVHKELQSKYDRCWNDNMIFAAKLNKERTELAEKEKTWLNELNTLREKNETIKKRFEEQKREIRIEFEENMGKMKERMIAIHKESKLNQERELHERFATAEQVYTKKLQQLDLRCAQLQEQLAEKNERDLEIRKENQVLLLKLKTLEDSKSERKLLLPIPAQARLRNNLLMEDEEGEVFNMTYLADLKSGRCGSPEAGEDRYSELLQRNSMLPPHLRTSYATLYPECDTAEDETRGNVSEAFDDSSTGLITRRKVSGVTSYKRPGPPTPSKKAGRLSFGAALPIVAGQIQYKEALKDANVNSANLAGSSDMNHNSGDGTMVDGKTKGMKTPSKFKQILSSTNLLGNFQRNELL
ncbi:DNA ligase 1-like [Anopheles bellator]|uniref:DNA ligase 1-like n=1 Tax=Anopheles bellator TaxID=139047 RepID=UPI002649807D|nr:DNA ligase 1-like [Anopheles bellator]